VVWAVAELLITILQPHPAQVVRVVVVVAESMIQVPAAVALACMVAVYQDPQEL
jgi:hypothetical protein